MCSGRSATSRLGVLVVPRASGMERSVGWCLGSVLITYESMCAYIWSVRECFAGSILVLVCNDARVLFRSYMSFKRSTSYCRQAFLSFGLFPCVD